VKYRVHIPDNVEYDILRHRMSGARSVLKKINDLLTELEEHPRTGTGKPDYKKYDLRGLWSRRITDTHRLVYDIDDEKMIVVIVSAWGHYNDK
jgi:toxin YoeB